MSIIKFIKSEIILIIAWIAAIITIFFVPISKEYFHYINFPVLSILFCLMAVVAGFIQTGVFDLLSQKLLSKSNNIKVIALILVSACFFSAMLVTNDVALLTFVPLTIGIMKNCRQKQLAFIVVMETIAANIGSMMTPIGNPQNLYLYSFYNMNISEFFQIVLPVCVAGFILILAFVWIIPKETVDIEEKGKIPIGNKYQLIGYSILFLLSIFAVLHIIDYRVTLAITVIGLFLLNKKIFFKVDYSLLFTFVAFFIFVGNLSNIEWVKRMITSLMSGKEFISAVMISQVISNVPAAIMLSGFTTQAKELLLGVNVGGMGTLVASLASLISFKLYVKNENAKSGLYIFLFTFCNIIMLIFLIAVVSALK
ncbi:MAG: SLC13 family permease [Oscillospiraceae bacterium]